jgi:hypothetical protein
LLIYPFGIILLTAANMNITDGETVTMKAVAKAPKLDAFGAISCSHFPMGGGLVLLFDYPGLASALPIFI